MTLTLNEESALQAMNEAVAAIKLRESPPLEGRGIVICGGGTRYFTCAWVCINMLRHVGCKLPIELWHLGAEEMSEEMRQFVAPLNVKCVDATEVRKLHPARILNGWELKCYAIIHSSFREVLLLDADNVPVVDPEKMFESPEYRTTGAVFWPDYGRLGPRRNIWRLTGVAYQDEPEFETGQIVVDKYRCFDALALTMWMNEHSDFWYRHIHGDKETFHLAWRKLERAYSMPARGIHALNSTMCQHDFCGKRLFQHRNLAKWSLNSNRHIPGFEHEAQCLKFLDELKPLTRVLLGIPEFKYDPGCELAGREAIYHRVGHDRRPMVLESDGTIGKGQARLERYWRVVRTGSLFTLEIYGDDGLTARLTGEVSNPRAWRGRWLMHERMPLEMDVVQVTEVSINNR